MIKLKSLLEATKIRGANNKMVEVPKSYNDKTGKFAYRFYRTPGMGGDLTSGLEFGYRRYHQSEFTYCRYEVFQKCSTKTRLYSRSYGW